MTLYLWGGGNGEGYQHETIKSKTVHTKMSKMKIIFMRDSYTLIVLAKEARGKLE